MFPTIQHAHTHTQTLKQSYILFHAIVFVSSLSHHFIVVAFAPNAFFSRNVTIQPPTPTSQTFKVFLVFVFSLLSVFSLYKLLLRWAAENWQISTTNIEYGECFPEPCEHKRENWSFPEVVMFLNLKFLQLFLFVKREKSMRIYSKACKVLSMASGFVMLKKETHTYEYIYVQFNHFFFYMYNRPKVHNREKTLWWWLEKI